MTPLFTPRAIGFVQSPYKQTAEIPKGLGAKHDAEGSLEILPEFAPGLADIEGFSHLFVLWFFDRSTDFDFLPLARHAVPIPLRSLSWNCSIATAHDFEFAAW